MSSLLAASGSATLASSVRARAVTVAVLLGAFSLVSWALLASTTSNWGAIWSIVAFRQGGC